MGSSKQGRTRSQAPNPRKPVTFKKSRPRPRAGAIARRYEILLNRLNKSNVNPTSIKLATYLRTISRYMSNAQRQRITRFNAKVSANKTGKRQRNTSPKTKTPAANPNTANSQARPPPTSADGARGRPRPKMSGANSAAQIGPNAAANRAEFNSRGQYRAEELVTSDNKYRLNRRLNPTEKRRIITESKLPNNGTNHLLRFDVDKDDFLELLAKDLIHDHYKSSSFISRKQPTSVNGVFERAGLLAPGEKVGSTKPTITAKSGIERKMLDRYSTEKDLQTKLSYRDLSTENRRAALVENRYEYMLDQTQGIVYSLSNRVFKEVVSLSTLADAGSSYRQSTVSGLSGGIKYYLNPIRFEIPGVFTGTINYSPRYKVIGVYLERSIFSKYNGKFIPIVGKGGGGYASVDKGGQKLGKFFGDLTQIITAIKTNIFFASGDKMAIAMYLFLTQKDHPRLLLADIGQSTNRANKTVQSSVVMFYYPGNNSKYNSLDKYTKELPRKVNTRGSTIDYRKFMQTMKCKYGNDPSIDQVVYFARQAVLQNRRFPQNKRARCTDKN